MIPVNFCRLLIFEAQCNFDLSFCIFGKSESTPVLNTIPNECAKRYYYYLSPHCLMVLLLYILINYMVILAIVLVIKILKGIKI